MAVTGRLGEVSSGRLGVAATARPGGVSSGLSAPRPAVPLFITPCAAAAHEGGGARDEWREEEGREGFARSLSPPARKEAWREEERIAQEEYERAMLAYQQDHLDQFGYYDDEGDATVRDYFEAQRRARVDEEVLRKWKTEELLAMAQESGPKLAEALAALKRGHDGKIAPESLASIQEAVREGVAAEAEGNLRVVNSTDIAAGSNATQEILTGLMRVTDEHRQMEKEDEADDAAFVARMRAEYPNSGDWNDDEMEPVPGIERPESLFSPLFSKYAEHVGFKSHSEFNETVPAVKRLQFVDQ